MTLSCKRAHDFNLAAGRNFGFCKTMDYEAFDTISFFAVCLHSILTRTDLSSLRRPVIAIALATGVHL